MKFTMALFFLSLACAFRLNAQESLKNCDGAKTHVSLNVEYIKDSFKTQDVSSYVENIKNIVKNCNLNIAEFGWNSNIYDYWNRTGYEAELTMAKKQVEHYSQFREVTPELNQYKKYAEKLGKNAAEVKQYSFRYRTQASQSAQNEAKKCQPSYDLRNNVLGAVRDQDSIGWCYAFAAADLITYKTGKKISAADVAMNYNDKWINNLFKKLGRGEQDFEGGWAESAIKATRRNGGACLEANLKSDDNGYSSLLSTLTEIEKSKLLTSQPTGRNCTSAAKSMFPNLEMDELLDIMEKASRSELIKLLSDKACAPRINMSGLKTNSVSANTQIEKLQLFDEIDKQLSRKNISAIAYNSYSLYNVDTNRTGPHESVVVGRRYNKTNGECEYLVRNSWGRGCSRYDKKLSCENGNIWVPKSVLVKGIFNVTYIQ